MSLGYAQKLSYREDVGTVGMSEIIDAPEILQEKIEELAMLIQKSKHLVAFTGAGISTSCGIPDFRGPKGVWTLQRAGKGVPDASLPFDRAMPSFTHMALVELEKAGILKFVISQNVDGLHLRSGIPREKLAELHGNSFREVCPSCGIEYIRDFEIETIGMKETSRRCSNEACGAKLKDTVLDWEDALPPKEMNPAQKHCKMADIVLCLGTSLQITPACNLPLKCLANGGRIIIINLQPTPKDKKAKLVIHGQVDKVIAGAMQFLNLRIPPYVRIDLIQFTLSHILKRRIKYVQWTLRITSVHGNRAPLPFLKSVEVSFPERSDLKTAVLDKQPFFLKRETLKTRPFKMVLDLYFGDGCGCLCTRIEWNVNFQNVIAGSPYSLIPSFHGSALSASPIWEIFHKIISFDKVWDDPFHDGTSYQESEVTRDAFSHDKLAVLQKLRDAAITDSCCGQYAAVERKLITSSKSKSSESDVTVYAIVTNISRHNSNLLPDPIPGGMNKTSSRCLQDEKSTPNQRGTGGATTRAVWNPLVDQLFANVMVNYMMHTRKSAGEWLDSAGWDMVASEFNRRNSSTYNVNQLKKHFGTLKRLYKSVKELLAVSGFQWDESSKLVVAKVAVWDNYLKSHPSAAQFRTTAFPAYELMSILCGDSSDFKSFDKLGGSSPMARDAASASSSQDVLGKPQLSPDEVSCSLASKENGNFVFQFEGDTRNPLPRRKRSLTPVHLHHCKRECVKQIRSDISDSLCEMETKPKFMRDQRRPEAQSPADYSISNCVKELMKIAPVNPMSRVIASRHFENSNLREMFMVWGKEERIAWLDMISKEH